MICKHCNQQIPEDEIGRRRKQKSDRIKLARKEAKIRGEQVGAKKKYDRDLIKKYLSYGKSIRETARIVGCSTFPVSEVAKELK